MRPDPNGCSRPWGPASPQLPASSRRPQLSEPGLLRCRREDRDAHRPSGDEVTARTLCLNHGRRHSVQLSVLHVTGSDKGHAAGRSPWGLRAGEAAGRGGSGAPLLTAWGPDSRGRARSFSRRASRFPGTAAGPGGCGSGRAAVTARRRGDSLGGCDSDLGFWSHGGGVRERRDRMAAADCGDFLSTVLRGSQVTFPVRRAPCL